jgi:hypothetical protein
VHGGAWATGPALFGFQNIVFVINKDKYVALGGTAFMGIIRRSTRC